MKLNEYQDNLVNYLDNPTGYAELGPFYTILVAQSNLGKLSEKLKDIMNKDTVHIDEREKMNLSISIGDLLSNLTMMATSLELKLNDIASLNLRKLSLIKQQKLKEKIEAEN